VVHGVASPRLAGRLAFRNGHRCLCNGGGNSRGVTRCRDTYSPPSNPSREVHRLQTQAARVSTAGNIYLQGVQQEDAPPHIETHAAPKGHEPSNAFRNRRWQAPDWESEVRGLLSGAVVPATPRAIHLQTIQEDVAATTRSPKGVSETWAPRGRSPRVGGRGAQPVSNNTPAPKCHCQRSRNSPGMRGFPSRNSSPAVT